MRGIYIVVFATAIHSAIAYSHPHPRTETSAQSVTMPISDEEDTTNESSASKNLTNAIQNTSANGNMTETRQNLSKDGENAQTEESVSVSSPRRVMQKDLVQDTLEAEVEQPSTQLGKRGIVKHHRHTTVEKNSYNKHHRAAGVPETQSIEGIMVQENLISAATDDIEKAKQKVMEMQQVLNENIKNNARAERYASEMEPDIANYTLYGTTPSDSDTSEIKSVTTVYRQSIPDSPTISRQENSRIMTARRSEMTPDLNINRVIAARRSDMTPDLNITRVVTTRKSEMTPDLNITRVVTTRKSEMRPDLNITRVVTTRQSEMTPDLNVARVVTAKRSEMTPDLNISRVVAFKQSKMTPDLNVARVVTSRDTTPAVPKMTPRSDDLYDRIQEATETESDTENNYKSDKDLQGVMAEESNSSELTSESKTANEAEDNYGLPNDESQISNMIEQPAKAKESSHQITNTKTKEITENKDYHEPDQLNMASQMNEKNQIIENNRTEEKEPIRESNQTNRAVLSPSKSLKVSQGNETYPQYTNEMKTSQEMMIRRH